MYEIRKESHEANTGILIQVKYFNQIKFIDLCKHRREIVQLLITAIVFTHE